MTRLLDLTGQQYGRLVVVTRAASTGQKVRWQCRCSCGSLIEAQAANLSSGHTQSCGCFRADIQAKHGHAVRDAGTPTYEAWKAMRARTTNPRHPRYPDYGGRGITVCDRWATFAHFLADLGERPSADLSLDRIDNEGNYEPGNCRWATRSEQQRNQRRRRKAVS